MKLAYRLALLVLALAGLIYGLAFETHSVRPIEEGKAAAEDVDALGFVKGTTEDAYILRGGLLCDSYSLVPESAQVRDCKT